MKPLDPPEFITMYILVQQNSSSLYFSTTGTAGSGVSYGSGFYGSREDAEKARTVAVLADKNDPANKFHIFELEFPNPAHKGG